MKSFTGEGCGYCRECVRLRVLSAVGRKPESAMECAYKHILDSYASEARRPGEHSGAAPSCSATPGDSCCSSNCRWTSSGSSSRPSYDDLSFSDEYEPAPYSYRKRIKFVKRKKV